MKNFKVTAIEDGKEYWISRALAVTGVIRARKLDKQNPNQLPKSFYLVSKRGSGCPDHNGKWQCTCGYLDFDETLMEAVLREIKEELGLDLEKAIMEQDPENPVVYSINLLAVRDDPEADARQNVTFRYLIDVDYDWVSELMMNDTINIDTESRGGEPGEIESIALVSCMDLDREPFLNNWAFNHYELLDSLGYDNIDSETDTD